MNYMPNTEEYGRFDENILEVEAAIRNLTNNVVTHEPHVTSLTKAMEVSVEATKPHVKSMMIFIGLVIPFVFAMAFVPSTTIRVIMTIFVALYMIIAIAMMVTILATHSNTIGYTNLMYNTFYMQYYPVQVMINAAKERNVDVEDIESILEKVENTFMQRVEKLMPKNLEEFKKYANEEYVTETIKNALERFEDINTILVLRMMKADFLNPILAKNTQIAEKINTVLEEDNGVEKTVDIQQDVNKALGMDITDEQIRLLQYVYLKESILTSTMEFWDFNTTMEKDAVQQQD